MRASTRLRQLLAQPDTVLAPGVYDAIGARLAEQAGCPALYMTGAGVSASLGYPDYGLVTMGEMVERAGVIARSVAVPLVSDADTGYGNELNVTRTVREFEMRGVAAIHLEDQVSPKRCGHLEGKVLVSRDEFVSKIRAAVAARRDPDFVVIARTDARAVDGLDEAIDRANAALEAGADMAFVESPASLDEVAAIPRRVRGPCLLNLVQGGKTPLLELSQVQALGYRLAIVPGALLVPTIVAADAALADLVRTRRIAPPPPGLDVRQVFRRFGAKEWDAIRERFE
ncbi:MAG: isocitrate lyase/PEP mutase family protein [Rubrivivax sp.]|nr:isocitrate lyase/PEP mutase family protein [Rubrivivax sp.]